MTKERNASRSRRIEETRKTADNHRQPWTSEEDQAVLDHGTSLSPEGEPKNDMELAVHLGRTLVAVSQRRVVLHKLMDSGLGLQEIHEVERHRRAVSNNRTYTIVSDRLRAMCPECFCYPHIPGCSNDNTREG